ncbi:MAG TPA: glutamate synthase subunit beta [bacterium]|nr:glutamate synthase subunit beta [bacterium]
MAKVTGFMEFHRPKGARRPVAERVKDWKEYELPYPGEELNHQAARCMDCGVPYCMSGCPLGNIIPDFNDLVYHSDWANALERLHATNNFPEFTGGICPAPCENSCTLALDQYQEPVSIKKIELAIVDKGWAEGWIKPLPPERETGKSVAVVGSGPAGLACAQQLRRAGHKVTVFERADRVGGLLRYGIPEFKLEKSRLERRVKQLSDEGVRFVVNANAGVNPTPQALKKDFDAVVLCGGATQARDLAIEGRGLKGVHFAMEFLTQSNKVQEGDTVEGQISAKAKHVVIIGGGDTGADCIGTSTRQGALDIHSLEIVPQPPVSRPQDNPWPQWARIFRTAGAHEEGGERLYAVSTRRFVGENGVLKGLETVQVRWDQGKPVEVAGSEKVIPADLCFLAMGFTGPEKGPLLDGLGVELDARGNVKSDPSTKMTSVPGIFTAGDMTRGQSLVVWAISEGRKAAQGVDRFLMGSTALPSAL